MVDMEDLKIKKDKKVIALIAVAGFIFLSSIFIITFLTNLLKKDYYMLEVNESNISYIIGMLEFENIEYCESIYKIEYTQLFPNDKSATIYCQNGKNIDFVFCDHENSKLATYIQKNGIHGKE